MAVPFIDLAAQRARIQKTLDQRIETVFAHGQFVLGPEVDELEKTLAQRHEVAHAISCANGTDALVLALRAEGIGVGDAVFVPAFTFAAAAEAVLLCGAVPFFVDIDDEFGIEKNSLKRAIVQTRAQGLVAKAIIAVELYGLPVDLEDLLAVAKEEGLFFLIDAAQSLGARYRGTQDEHLGGRSTVSLGDAAITSFFPTKPLGCYGDGGCVFTQDAERALILREIANHGQEAGHRYRHRRLGTNSRLDTLQAAILLAKMTVFDEEILLRQKIAETYNSLFEQALQKKGVSGAQQSLSLPRVPAGRSSVWGQYTLRCSRRDAIRESCAAAGVATSIHYPLALCDQEAFRHCPVVEGGVPSAERAAREVISLPMHPLLSLAQQQEVVAAVVKALGNNPNDP